jgi:hypothetical protein|tara:strand:- start:128 stop:307 length:180 start_codon:yes stop_codon:yes gene_type:complete
MDELSMAMVVLVPGAAAVAWLVTLHSRVRAHSEQLLEMKTDIRYIRERIDRAVTAKSQI